MIKDWNRKQSDGIYTVITLYSFSCFLLLFCDCFKWEFFKGATILLLPGIKIGCFIILSILCLLAFMMLFIFQGKKTAYLPFIFSVISLLVITFGFTTNIYVYTKFYFQQKDMERAAVTLLEELPQEDLEWVLPLPEELQNLSSSKSVRIQSKDSQLKFMFDTFIGFADSYSGFVYVPGETEIEDGDFGFDLTSSYTSCIKISKHWYWISST